MMKPNKHVEEHNPLIIERPEALSDWRRRTEWSITTIGWLIWFVICRPIFIILLWVLGFRFFYEHMIRLEGFLNSIDLFFIYAWVILFIFLCIRGWNYYNKRRFKNKNRRAAVKNTEQEDLEHFFHLAKGAARDLHQWNEIVVDFEDDPKHMHFHEKQHPKAHSHRGHFRST